MKFFFVFFAMFGLVLMPFSTAIGVSVSDQVKTQLEAGANKANLGEPADPREVVAGVIKAVLGLLGIIFMVLVFIGGYNLMIARGEEDKISKAKDTIRRAVIGLIVILLSYAIVRFVSGGVMSAIFG